jgi:diguanylate cyclase (GGDEF)-like protein
LPNTEYLKRLFASDGRFAGESLHPLTLLLIDVGPTGATREVYGAGVADQVMAHAAIAIRRSLRGADILFRYDDDEFVVLLARTDADLADQVARRIVEAAANLKLVVSPDEEISIAIRVGGATAPGDGRSRVSLF